MALGNAIGSNIFNILMVLGIASAISPIRIITENIIDLCVLLVFTVCVWIFAGTKKKIGRTRRFLYGCTLCSICRLYHYKIRGYNRKMILFLKVFFTEFIAEMGDKTQLMLIALTSKYKLKDIILGTAAAILVLNGLAVLAGGLVSEFVPDWLLRRLQHSHFFTSQHQPFPVMMTRKRKKAENQRFSSPRSPFSVHFL